jgi:hypothetical protein
MTTVTPIVDFNALESFHLLFKNLWSMNIAYRVKLNVVDTVLYKEGKPFCWLFTSEQTGVSINHNQNVFVLYALMTFLLYVLQEIMKRKDERLESVYDIIRSFKLKSRDYTGSKESIMRNKIAIVWYMESDRKVLSHIVDEAELKIIMSNNLTEILCIQTYIGGMYFRGNGIFEHRMWTQKDGSVKHITYESINMQRGGQDAFTCECEKIAVTEHQHGALSSIAKHLATHIAFVNKCKVTGLIIQAVFSEGWVPHVVAAKKFNFANVTFDSEENREEAIYPTGRAPSAPTVNPNSLLLPRTMSDRVIRTATAMAATFQRTNSQLTTTAAAGATTATRTRAESASEPAQDDIPAAPAMEFTPGGTVRKVRSSSVSYDSRSAKYPNYFSEQERVAAQRQLSAQSQQNITTALEEAKEIAGEDTFAVGGSRSVKLAGVSSKQPMLRGASAASLLGPSTPMKKQSQSMKTSALSSSSQKYALASLVPSTPGDAASGGASELTKPIGPSTTAVSNEVLAAVSAAVSGIASRGAQSLSPDIIGVQAPSASGKFVATTLFDDAGATDGSAGQTYTKSEKLQMRKAMGEIGPIKRYHGDVEEEEREETLRVPYIDPAKEPSRVNYSTEDYYATVHMGAKPSALHQLQASKAKAAPVVEPVKAKATATGGGGKNKALDSSGKLPNSAATMTRTGRTAQLASTARTAGPPPEYPSPGKSAPIERLFRPDSAQSVGKLRQTMEKVRALAGAAGGQTGTAASSGRLAVKKTSSIGAQWDPTPWQLQAFETNTEASFTQTQFYKARLQDDEAELKKLGMVFEKRRPISAPHNR